MAINFVIVMVVLAICTSVVCLQAKLLVRDIMHGDSCQLGIDLVAK